MDTLHVLIISADPLTRAGLAALLADPPDLTVSGQISVEQIFETGFDIFQPDVILFDLGWETGAALDALADLDEPGTPVVALLSDPDLAPDVWRLDVAGVLPREASVEQLRTALAGARHNLRVLAPEFAAALTSPPAMSNPAAPIPEPLTPRESEVLQLLAEGLPNKTIARRLGISEHTVKFHVNAILGKLNAQSRTEAVVRASQAGLILL
ncbi:MAG: DNA-binding response regulator [Chloroflexi bacterium]|nr:MAG: DNA-binding response regulator [Chloroflexota bacterium]